MYSYPGDLVLDPFVGSGQTSKVAYWLKRDYVGYETISKYVELTKRRIKEPLSVRPQQLIAVFDKVGLDEPSGQGQEKRSNKRKARQNDEMPTQAQLFETKAKYPHR